MHINKRTYTTFQCEFLQQRAHGINDWINKNTVRVLTSVENLEISGNLKCTHVPTTISDKNVGQ